MRNKAICLLLFLFAIASHAQAKEKILNIQHWTTSKGADVYFVAAPQIPILDIKMAFDAGSAQDGAKPGVAALTANLLNQGSNNLTSTEIAEKFDNIGANYSVTVARDKSVISLRTLTDPAILKQALENFNAILGHPDFPAKAFEQKKGEQSLGLQSNLQSPTAIASDTLYATLYPEQPYSHPVFGTDSSIAKLSTDDVKDFYHNYYVVKNATIAIVGAIDTTTAKNIVEQITQDLPAGTKPKPTPLATQLPKPVVKHVDFPATQTVICLGQVGITHDSPDYFPLLVGNYSLGGGMLVSRLSLEVREKRGLSYYIYSTFNPLPARGPFLIALATKRQTASQALALTQTTFQQFLAEGPNDQELTAAKQYMTGNFPLHFTSNEDIANIILAMGFYHLPLDYLDTYVGKVNAVTTAQSKKAFTKLLNPTNLATITVGTNA